VPQPEPAVPVPPGFSEGLAPLLLRRDAPFPMPESAEAEQRPGQLTLRVPDNVGRFPMAAVLGALGLGTVFYALATAVGDIGFNLGVTVTTLASAYLVMQAVVNQRHFHIDASGLHSSAGPLPWLRPELHLTGIEELFVERNWTEDGRTSYRFIWELYARTSTAPRVSLLEGASDPVLVHWLGQELAAQLGVRFSPAKDPPRQG
jgi:hypothetical protein